jgi:hypothetical protein
MEGAMGGRLFLVIWSASCVLAAVGCGDDDGAGTGGAGDAGGGAAGHAGTRGGAGAAAGTGAAGSGGGGMPQPTSSIRVVNLVPDVTFDAWGPGPDRQPMRLAEGLEYATASDYFEAPVNELTMDPIFVLWKSGDEPPEGMSFSMLLDDSHERVRIEVRELDGPGERATITVEPQDPFDENPTAALEYETLDETELDRGDASKLNLHVSYHLFGIGDGIVDSFALEGEPCLHDGSTNVAEVFSVAAGESTLAVYDRQTGAACSLTEPLATLPIDGEAGDNLLVAIYREANDVKMLSAPIE